MWKISVSQRREQPVPGPQRPVIVESYVKGLLEIKKNKKQKIVSQTSVCSRCQTEASARERRKEGKTATLSDSTGCTCVSRDCLSCRHRHQAAVGPDLREQRPDCAGRIPGTGTAVRLFRFMLIHFMAAGVLLPCLCLSGILSPHLPIRDPTVRSSPRSCPLFGPSVLPASLHLQGQTRSKPGTRSLTLSVYRIVQQVSRHPSWTPSLIHSPLCRQSYLLKCQWLFTALSVSPTSVTWLTELSLGAILPSSPSSSLILLSSPCGRCASYPGNLSLAQMPHSLLPPSLQPVRLSTWMVPPSPWFKLFLYVL